MLCMTVNVRHAVHDKYGDVFRFHFGMRSMPYGVCRCERRNASRSLRSDGVRT